jgi:hypothetical protein
MQAEIDIIEFSRVVLMIPKTRKKESRTRIMKSPFRILWERSQTLIC